MTSGAGSVWKTGDRVERVYKRDLDPVPKGYTQEMLPYQESFWEQYKYKLVCCLAGVVASGGLLALASSSLLGDADVWGMWPTLAFLIATFPLMVALPIWWYIRHRRLKRIFNASDAGEP